MKFCYQIGLHWWKVTNEKHKVINHPNNRKHIRIKVRQCRLSGVREYYSIADNYWKGEWKICPFKKDEIINYKEIKQHANTSI